MRPLFPFCNVFVESFAFRSCLMRGGGCSIAAAAAAADSCQSILPRGTVPKRGEERGAFLLLLVFFLIRGGGSWKVRRWEKASLYHHIYPRGGGGGGGRKFHAYSPFPRGRHQSQQDVPRYRMRGGGGARSHTADKYRPKLLSLSHLIIKEN